ncbi:brachyurin-like [Euwallacea fornicatus]|uniref:brachyurin-like n=1 Tax=Euwallacea fornicatus TaxID=995702 RepID=UPI00338FB613
MYSNCFIVVFVILTILSRIHSYSRLEIVNGDEVVPHSLPYVVFLESVINGKTVRCGGSLIRQDQILTAASCLYEAKNVSIILGAHNIEENEATQFKIDGATNFTIHGNYTPDTHANDIALINLDANVPLANGSIALISTPSLEDIVKTYADDLGLVAGWGKTNDTDPTYSPVLRKIEITIIPFLSCTIPYLFKVTESQICTTGTQNSKNICLGDSGSPLVVNGTQVGVASYGSDFGCSVGAPGVYTRLTSYYFWLTANLH